MRRHRRALDELDALKAAAGCAECGFAAHPGALQFHHVDPATKDAPVSRMASFSTAKRAAEIAKCRILCANCHAIHHFEEKRAARRPIPTVPSGTSGTVQP